jgi:hypothetical protein
MRPEQRPEKARPRGPPRLPGNIPESIYSTRNVRHVVVSVGLDNHPASFRRRKIRLVPNDEDNELWEQSREDWLKKYYPYRTDEQIAQTLEYYEIIDFIELGERIQKGEDVEPQYDPLKQLWDHMGEALRISYPEYSDDQISRYRWAAWKSKSQRESLLALEELDEKMARKHPASNWLRWYQRPVR